MKKVLIVADNLKVGGIQKSLFNLLNNIDYKKVQIDCVLFNKDHFYKFDNKEIIKNVNFIYLKHHHKITKFILFKIFKIICKNSYKSEKEYDIAIDFDSYQHDTALAVINANAKRKVMWIHNDVKEKIKEEKKYKILHIFMKGKYKYFDKFIGVSEGVIEPFKKINKQYNKDYEVIPNYIDTKEIITKSEEKVLDLKLDKRKYNFVSVGRLCHQKGFDILIDNIEKLSKIKQDFHLYIIGDGEDKDLLHNLVKEKNVDSYITFLGDQKNPFKYLKLMDGFVLTSRYEGQGMVFLEALCLGLEIFMPKHLEKYNAILKGVGSDNLVESMSKATKKNKKINMLKEYNDNIMDSFIKLISDN